MKKTLFSTSNNKTIKSFRIAKIRSSILRRHPFVVPLATLGVLLVVTIIAVIVYGGQVVTPSDSKVVKLYIDGKNQTIPTRATTVREMLSRSNVQLAAEDHVEPSLEAPINSGEFTINVYRAKPVTVIDEDGKKIVTKTAEAAPATMAKKAGFNLYPEDNVAIEQPDISLRQGVLGAKVVIDRATPVKLNLYGTTYDVRTHAKTVADLAKERNIIYDDKSVLPAVTTAITENEVIFITQPGKSIASSEDAIQFDEEIINDPGLANGTKEIRTAGVMGKKAVIYELTPDGRKKPLQEVIITQPVKQIVAKGKKVTAPNVSVGSDKAALMSQAGISADQQASADFVIGHESGWRPAARSANNCIGLGQKCNAASLINACPNWETDAVCQLRVFNSYAVSRYGSWNKAYAFWTVNHWW